MVDVVSNMETLRSLLIDEVKFLSGVSYEVKRVEADLRSIHFLLMEADQNRGVSDSPTFQNCIRELKELAFKAENIMETYAYEVESKEEGESVKKKLKRCSGIFCKWNGVHQIGKEITHIRSGLADLTTRLRSNSGGGDGSSDLATEEKKRMLRLRYAHEVEQHFVGMEKDIHSVVSMVKDDSPHTPSFISICGMGGLGKTTLARKIYHHEIIQRRFDGCAWVCVTQQFQADTILREILKQIDGEKKSEIMGMGLSELVQGLYCVLVHKKCLIVIDDIWETDHWEILRPAFSTNCIVVLTTRNENIASHECHVHKLGFLSEDEAWELLRKIALPINDDSTQVLESKSKSFEDIGKQMVRKCGCLPLAILVVGGILHQKQQILAEWVKINRNMDSYLRHGGEGTGNNTRVRQVLDLSFDVLPYYLKPCFLYLACFPEDKEIDTEQLYQLWLAEGLISSEGKGNNETLRDVAERFLTELAFRCMVQVKSSYINTPHKKFESCSLHDLMRDLCSSKAEEERLIKRVDFLKHCHDIPLAIGAYMHRLSINVEADDNDDATLSKICVEGLKDLRSFLFICKNRSCMRAIDSQNMLSFKNSKHLRILVLDGVRFEDRNLPSTVGKQIYLKYLSLHDCNVKELPQHICNLPYLQTLDLRVMYEIKLKLPNLIWKMKRLRHLLLSCNIEVIGGGKLKLDGLNELETLIEINSQSVCIADIINLTNLRTLSATLIEEDAHSLSKIVDYMSSNGCRLRETSLTVESCDLRNVLEKMLMLHSLVGLYIRKCETGCGFPSYKEGMCSNVVRLEFDATKIGRDLIEVFGRFPMLQSLWLEGEIIEEMRFAANSFPQLKILSLIELMNLHTWEVEKGAIPNLRLLNIFSCKYLEKLPIGLQFVCTLQTLRCNYMSEEFKSRYTRGRENGEGGGEDYVDFSHIPFFSIR